MFEIKRCTSSNLLLNYSTLATTNNVYIYDILKLCNKKEIDKIEMPDNQHWYWRRFNVRKKGVRKFKNDK